MLLFLGVLPLFVFLYIRLERRRRRFLVNNGGFGPLAGAAGRDPGLRREIPNLFFLGGLFLLILALARPQATVFLPQEEGIVILAFDVSGSMAADDLKPNRMEAAKEAARSFVVNQPAGIQIGVVAFSDSGFTVQAPTSDQETVLSTLNRLTPKQGTSLAHGMAASLEAIAAGLNQQKDSQGEAPQPPAGALIPAVIVLISDGENNEPPDPFAAAQEAANRGVRIYTVGIGSPAGAILNIEGFQVHTMLNEGMLQQIAQMTRGEYFHADNAQDLASIYKNLAPEWTIQKEDMEITSIFAGLSLLLLLAGGSLSLLWFSRLP
jgi:Ca-activated chloride channel family protein